MNQNYLCRTLKFFHMLFFYNIDYIIMCPKLSLRYKKHRAVSNTPTKPTYFICYLTTLHIFFSCEAFSTLVFYDLVWKSIKLSKLSKRSQERKEILNTSYSYRQLITSDNLAFTKVLPNSNFMKVCNHCWL